MTTTEAARELGVSAGRVRQWVAAGVIPVTRIGNYNLIDPRDLEPLRRRRTKPGPRPRKERPNA